MSIFPLYNFLKKNAGEFLTTKEIKERIHRYDYKAQKYKIIFIKNMNNYDKKLQGSSAYPYIIVFSAAWAKELLRPDEETENAFILSIGHELGHKHYGDYLSFSRREKTDKRFVCWVNEVHHDFYAAKIMIDYSLEKALSATRYKQRYKINNGEEDENYVTHPSWENRIKYIESGEFNSKLIDKIAEDAGCINSDLIKKLKNHYKESITLK